MLLLALWATEWTVATLINQAVGTKGNQSRRFNYCKCSILKQQFINATWIIRFGILNPVKATPLSLTFRTNSLRSGVCHMKIQN